MLLVWVRGWWNRDHHRHFRSEISLGFHNSFSQRPTTKLHLHSLLCPRLWILTQEWWKCCLSNSLCHGNCTWLVRTQLSGIPKSLALIKHREALPSHKAGKLGIIKRNHTLKPEAWYSINATFFHYQRMKTWEGRFISRPNSFPWALCAEFVYPVSCAGVGMWVVF